MNIRSNITGLAHIGIPTKDIEMTVAFYESLGFEVKHRTVNPLNGDKVAFLRLHNVMVETYECSDPSMASGAIDHIALDVSDVDKLFDELQMSGFKLIDQKVQTLPFWDHGVRFFTIEGPNREKVEFCQMI